MSSLSTPTALHSESEILQEITTLDCEVGSSPYYSNGLFIEAALPTKVTYNSEIEERLKLPLGWIKERTGIAQRRTHNAGVSTLAIEAAQKLLAKTKVSASTIDAVVFATVTPDHPWPASACFVASAIGATKALAFDISASCSGFLYGLSIVRSMILSGQCKRILLLAGDCMSSVIDPLDKNTSILFGDACTASLWTKSNIRSIVHLHLGSDGSGYNNIIVKNGGSQQPIINEVNARKLSLEGQPVFKAAVQHMTQSAQRALEESGYFIDDIQWFVPHQANMRIIDAVGQQLEMPKHKTLTNLEQTGNTTNASIPLCLFHHSQQFLPSDKILITVFGAGYTWGSAILDLSLID